MITLRRLLDLASAGPRIEFGVFRGATLLEISNHIGRTIGVDTFEGMPDPTLRDMKDGWNPYPKGRLSAPMAIAAAKAPKAELVRGLVPEILSSIEVAGFGFAHLDMDHFDSTLAALRWVWPRMVSGGVICCDDWFHDHDWLAAGAINAFALDARPLTGTEGRKAWWIVP